MIYSNGWVLASAQSHQWQGLGWDKSEVTVVAFAFDSQGERGWSETTPRYDLYVVILIKLASKSTTCKGYLPS